VSHSNLTNKIEKNKVIIILVFLVIVISIINARFLRIRNLMNVLMHASIYGIMALSMTTLMISGHFDLSIGSTLSIVGMITLYLQPTIGIVPSIIVGLCIGIGIGFINGIIVVFGRVNAFVATLGTMIIIKGISLSMNQGNPIPNKSMPYMEIGNGSIGIIPLPVIYFTLFIAVFIFIMGFTNFGRNSYAIGGNILSAKISGIKVRLYTILYFVLSGFSAAVAGVLLSSRLNVGSAVLGDNTPLFVISAVILGGTSLKGGIGSIRGTVLGLLVLGVVNSGMDLLNVQSYFQLIIRGSILVSVVLVDAYYGRLKARGILII